MAKTKGVKKRPSKRKPARKKRISKIPQPIRIIAGLSILIFLVVSVGLLVHHSLQRKSLRELVRQAGIQQPGLTTEPPYEIYPMEELPPPQTEKKSEKTMPGQLPKVAIIIDDIGYNRKMAEKFIQLDAAITISILPQSPFRKHIVKEARKNGLDIMLHQPMEPNEYPKINPGPGVLLSSMSPDEIIEQLNTNLDEIPGIKGVNNHMGSKMTANSPQMRQIFSVLKKRGLFFVDSRTTTRTMCKLSASLLQVPFAERDVFIDHRQDPEFIKKQIKELVRIAIKHGEAIGIAHPYRTTYKVLQESLPDLKKQVELVPVSQVVRIIS